MRVVSVATLFLPLVLAGCSLTSTTAPTPDAGVVLHGNVHGGQQPLVGTQIYLLAANTTGYGNASISLLNNVPGSTTLDSGGGSTNGDYYVTTDANGSFSLFGDYSCTSGQQIYLYALGGSAGTGKNPSAGLLAILGDCASLNQIQFVAINEVSTIAAAYAFAGFATDATYVSSSGTALAKTGIANAFLSGANLETLATGIALSTTPAGNGTVPRSEINTLADILATCINSNGAVTGPTPPTACYTLFANTLSGGASGSQPTDTATAAINIAHNPAANVAALSALPTAIVPFSPTLANAPNDFTIALSLTGGGLYEPGKIAIDAEGNVWAGNTDGENINNVSELSPNGTPLSPSTGYASSLAYEPCGITVDTSGYIWVVNTTKNTGVMKLSPDGTVVSGSPFLSGLTGCEAAADGLGNIWLPGGSAAGNIYKLNGSTGALVSPAGYPDPDGSFLAIDTLDNVWGSGGGTIISRVSNSGAKSPGSPYPASGGSGAIAIDASGNVWVSGGASTAKLTSIGTTVAGSPFSGGGQSASGFGFGLAIDGAGNVWQTEGQTAAAPFAGVISELNNAGAAVSPSTGYQTTLLNYPFGIAIDGSGNVWVADNDGPDMIEFVGAAVPVVTPLSTGIANSTLGTRP